MVALHFALLFSVAAMVLLIGSGALSEDGASDSPAMVAGNLLMHLVLAYTVVGFFQPLVAELSLRQLPTLRETEDFRVLLRAVSVSTAVIWALVAYAGPVVSLIRSPFGTRCNLALGAGYLMLMALLAHFFGVAMELQDNIEGKSSSHWLFLRLLFLPVNWFAHSPG